jgi:hypothetical protein
MPQVLDPTNAEVYDVKLPEYTDRIHLHAKTLLYIQQKHYIAPIYNRLSTTSRAQQLPNPLPLRQ